MSDECKKELREFRVDQGSNINKNLMLGAQPCVSLSISNSTRAQPASNLRACSPLASFSIFHSL